MLCAPPARPAATSEACSHRRGVQCPLLFTTASVCTARPGSRHGRLGCRPRLSVARPCLSVARPRLSVARLSHWSQGVPDVASIISNDPTPVLADPHWRPCGHGGVGCCLLAVTSQRTGTDLTVWLEAACRVVGSHLQCGWKGFAVWLEVTCSVVASWWASGLRRPRLLASLCKAAVPQNSYRGDGAVWQSANRPRAPNNLIISGPVHVTSHRKVPEQLAVLQSLLTTQAFASFQRRHLIRSSQQ